MTVKESRLSIVVDSMSAQQQIDGLRARLKTLEDAGLSVSQSMNSAGTSTGNAGQKAQSASVEMNRLIAEMRANAAATAELTKNVLGMNSSIDKLATNTLRESQRQTKMYTDAINSLNKSSRTASITTANANDSLENQTAVFARLVSQIDPVIGRLNKLDEQEEQLRLHFKNHLIEKDEFDSLKAKIDQSRESLNKFGNTGKSVAQAERSLAHEAAMVTPQLTDIITQLSTGQNPMTIFIEQGGQLRDVFGGVRPALAGTARVISSMINPITVATGAIVGMGIAWESETRNQERFANALAVTRNYAGATTTQLDHLAGQLNIQGASYGAVSKQIQQLAGSGKYSFGQIQTIMESITQTSITTGQSIDDLAKNFTDLSGNPVQALLNLDKQYHFITADQIRHINMLDQEGKHQEAVTEAMNLWANASDQANKRVQQNLNATEHTLNNLTELWNRFKHMLGSGITGAINYEASTFGRGTRQDDIDRLQYNIKTSQHDWLGRSLGFYGSKNSNELQLAVDYGKQIGAQLQQGIQDQVAQTNSSVAQKVGQKLLQQDKQHPRSSHAAVNQQIEQMMRERQAVTSLITPYNALDVAQAKYQGQLSDINRAVKEGSINEIEATVARVNAAASYDKVADSIHSTSDRLKEYQATLDAQRATQQQQNALQVAGVGMGTQEFQRAQQILQTQQQYQQQITQLAQQRSQTSDPNQQDYITGEIAAQKRMMDLVLGDQRDMYRQLDAMEGDWGNGAKAAWQDYLDQAKNTADMTKSLFSNTFSSATDDLANFVATGKLKMSDLTQEILSDLAKVAIQKSVLKLTDWLGGGSSGGESISSGAFGGISKLVGHTVGFSAGGYTGHGSKYQPAGVVHAGEYVVRSEITQQPGMRSFLDGLNRGYADGGYVSPRTYPPAQSAQQSNSSNAGDVHLHYSPVVQVDTRGSQDPQAIQQAAQHGARMVYQQIQQDFRSNGPLLRSIRQGVK